MFLFFLSTNQIENRGTTVEGKVEKGRVEHGKELCFKSQTNVVYLELVERVTIFNNPRGGGKKDNKMFNKTFNKGRNVHRTLESLKVINLFKDKKTR